MKKLFFVSLLFVNTTGCYGMDEQSKHGMDKQTKQETGKTLESEPTFTNMLDWLIKTNKKYLETSDNLANDNNPSKKKRAEMFQYKLLLGIVPHLVDEIMSNTTKGNNTLNDSFVCSSFLCDELTDKDKRFFGSWIKSSDKQTMITSLKTAIKQILQKGLLTNLLLSNRELEESFQKARLELGVSENEFSEDKISDPARTKISLIKNEQRKLLNRLIPLLHQEDLSREILDHVVSWLLNSETSWKKQRASEGSLREILTELVNPKLKQLLNKN